MLKKYEKLYGVVQSKPKENRKTYLLADKSQRSLKQHLTPDGAPRVAFRNI
jgi:hypothetical protein